MSIVATTAYGGEDLIATRGQRWRESRCAWSSLCASVFRQVEVIDQQLVAACAAGAADDERRSYFGRIEAACDGVLQIDLEEVPVTVVGIAVVARIECHRLR